MTTFLYPRQIEELNQFVRKRNDIINDKLLYDIYLQDNVFIDLECAIDKNILDINEFSKLINKMKPIFSSEA